MRVARWILAATLFMSLWIPGEAKADDLTAADRVRLEAGELVTRPLPINAETGGYVGGTSYLLIDAAPEAVWAAMQDIAVFPRVFPKTLSATVISDRGNRQIVRTVHGNSWLQVSLYVLFRVDSDARKIQWELVRDQPHDLADTRGFWQVQAYDGGRSLVTYANVVDLGSMAALAVFAEAIQNGLLAVPTNLRDWVMGPDGERYRRGDSTAATH
jgi:hypothetical protein